MSDKKHIDRLFQEKFKDFDVAPKKHVWETIEARLQEKKNKRRIVSIWWQFGGVAAALLLLFAVGNSILNTQEGLPITVETDDIKTYETNKENENLRTPNKDENSSVVSNTSDSDSNNIEEPENESGSLNISTKSSNNSKNNSYVLKRSNRGVVTQNTTTVNSNNRVSHSEINKTNAVASSNQQNDENSVLNKTELKSDEEINKILKSNTTNSTNAVVKLSDSDSNKENSGNTERNNPTENKTDTVIKKEKGQDIEEAIADANKTIEKEEQEREIHRWSVAPNVAPVYFNSLGEGSSIDAQFSNNNTTSDISMSYGVKGSYAINNRLKVTAGVNRVSFNNTTSDVIALSDKSFSSVAASAGLIQNIDLKESLNNSSLTLISRPNINANSVSESIRTIQTGDLEQRFGFIEIPLEVEYRLIDKKLGVNVSSGFSTLLLNDNEIFADVNGESTLLGEANNINNTSFSANFGIGIDYKLTEKLNINLEPKFKYQLNTFNNTSGDFRPFFIGVYTGLNFKF